MIPYLYRRGRLTNYSDVSNSASVQQTQFQSSYFSREKLVKTVNPRNNTMASILRLSQLFVSVVMCLICLCTVSFGPVGVSAEIAQAPATPDRGAPLRRMPGPAKGGPSAPAPAPMPAPAPAPMPAPAPAPMYTPAPVPTPGACADVC